MPETTLESDLIERAVGGDVSALEALLLGRYHLLAECIKRQIPRRLRSVLDVDDVLQHTLVNAFRSISSLRTRSSEALTAWLNTLAHRQVARLAEALQAQKRLPAVRPTTAVLTWSRQSVARIVEGLGKSSSTPSGSAARGEAVQAVRVAVAALPEEQRKAVQLHCVAGQTVGQTAAAMQRTPGAIRGIVQRAKQSLRRAMGRSSRWFSTR